VTGPDSEQGQSRLDDADYEKLAEFRYILRQFLIFSENAAIKAELTAQQHQALLAIRGVASQKAITTGELAERLGIRHHSAVGLVDRLAAKTLVVRRTGQDDRRQVFLELTPAAKTVLAKLSEAHRDELARLAPMLRAVLTHWEDSATETANGKDIA
jgi:DNA-binding MarR family transcriptional regulator